MGKKRGVFGIRSVEMGNVSTIGKHIGLDPENRYEVRYAAAGDTVSARVVVAAGGAGLGISSGFSRQGGGRRLLFRGVRRFISPASRYGRVTPHITEHGET